MKTISIFLRRKYFTRFNTTELIWLASKSKNYYFDYETAKELNGGKQMKNLWEIPAERHLTPNGKARNLIK
jgi:site-specific DNA-methyltransferase (adenine-specific)